MRDLAAAAKLLGFAGLAFDQELYPHGAGRDDRDLGLGLPRQHPLGGRGAGEGPAARRELMGAILDGFPGAELMAYDVVLPEAWGELVQEEVNGTAKRRPTASTSTSGTGCRASRATARSASSTRSSTRPPTSGPGTAPCTTTPTAPRHLLAPALQLGLRLRSRLSVSPFSWIDTGPEPSAFDDARSPDYVAEQLLAFRKWGMGGEFANYAYAALADFDYSPYVRAMQEGQAGRRRLGGSDRCAHQRAAGTGHDRRERARQPRGLGSPLARRRGRLRRRQA